MHRAFVPVAIFLILALCTSGCRKSEGTSENDSLYYEGFQPIQPFRLVNQAGNSVTPDDLKGRVWIASFFFSTCPDCPTKHMPNLKRLYQDLSAIPDIMLVSFSVNPTTDTPEQLAAYAESFGADPGRWQFLTGPEDKIYSLSEKTFQQAAVRNDDAPDGRLVIHSFKFLLVDHRGKIRGYVDGTDPSEVDRLGERAKKLVMAKYLPTINASLNGLAACLLVLGFLAIRTKRIRLHKAAMLTALTVSALFLATYLFYHFWVLDGKPTHFSGQGSVRTVYFSILLSHTLLAIVAAPMAIASTYFGLRDRIARHRALARWTLPIWLYVSVTGVVVYWMLYHAYPPQ